jgi:hypothetical protein
MLRQNNSIAVKAEQQQPVEPNRELSDAMGELVHYKTVFFTRQVFCVSLLECNRWY